MVQFDGSPNMVYDARIGVGGARVPGVGSKRTMARHSPRYPTGSVQLILNAHKSVTHSPQPICLFHTLRIERSRVRLIDRGVEVVGDMQGIGSLQAAFIAGHLVNPTHHVDWGLCPGRKCL